MDKNNTNKHESNEINKNEDNQIIDQKIRKNNFSQSVCDEGNEESDDQFRTSNSQIRVIVEVHTPPENDVQQSVCDEGNGESDHQFRNSNSGVRIMRGNDVQQNVCGEGYKKSNHRFRTSNSEIPVIAAASSMRENDVQQSVCCGGYKKSNHQCRTSHSEIPVIAAARSMRENDVQQTVCGGGYKKSNHQFRTSNSEIPVIAAARSMRENDVQKYKNKKGGSSKSTDRQIIKERLMKLDKKTKKLLERNVKKTNKENESGSRIVSTFPIQNKSEPIKCDRRNRKENKEKLEYKTSGSLNSLKKTTFTRQSNSNNKQTISTKFNIKKVGILRRNDNTDMSEFNRRHIYQSHSSSLESKLQNDKKNKNSRSRRIEIEGCKFRGKYGK